MERIAIGLSDPASQKAVDWVIDRARSRTVEVTLVAAFARIRTPSSQVTELLRTARERIGNASPRTVVHLAPVDGDPIRALVEASERADLVVVGAHAREGLASWREAPSLTVARSVRSATVIVPEGWHPTGLGTVLVGVDDDSSASALAFAAREAEQRGAQLEVVRAWTAPLPAYDPLVWIVDTEGELRLANRARLDEAVTAVRAEHPGMRVRSTLAECLANIALRDRAAHADLIVLGTHRRGPITGLVTGSTARELLKDVDIPLCIVPRERQETSRRSHAATPAAAATASTATATA